MSNLDTHIIGEEVARVQGVQGTTRDDTSASIQPRPTEDVGESIVNFLSAVSTFLLVALIFFGKEERSLPRE